MNIFLLKDYQMGEKTNKRHMGLRTSDDMECESRWEIYFSSNSVDCLRNLGSVFEEDVSLACLDFTKQ